MKDIVIPTLEADDIEVKIKQVTKKGAFALLYKTARTDMRYLDEVYGIMNWQVSYQTIGDALYCTISVWDDEKKQWISKQSNGIPSRADGDGNEVKGEASDALKRAGFLFSVGRELYSSPRVFLNIATKEEQKNGKTVYVLEDPWAKYVVTDISYDKKRKVEKLIIANEKTGEVVYTFGVNASANRAKKQQEPPKQEVPKREPPKQEQTSIENKVNAVVETAPTLPTMNAKDKVFYAFLAKHNIEPNDNGKKRFAELRAMAIRGGKDVSRKKYSDMTQDELIMLIATMENLFDEGFFEGVS